MIRCDAATARGLCALCRWRQSHYPNVAGTQPEPRGLFVRDCPNELVSPETMLLCDVHVARCLPLARTASPTLDAMLRMDVAR